MALINVLQGLDDLAGFIATPQPDRPFENAVGDAGRLVCDSLANSPAWAGNFVPFITGASALSAIKTVCQPYYNANGFDGPTLGSSFPPGQCPVRYRLQVEQRVFRANIQDYAWVPGFIFEFNGPLTVTGGASGGTCSRPGDTAQNWTLSSPNETTTRNLFSGCADTVPGFRWLIQERLDGQPDECGDPQPELVPGTNRPLDPGPLPPDIEPRLNDDGEPVFGVPPFDPGGGFPAIEIPTAPGTPGAPVPVAPPGGPNSPGDPESVGDSAGTTPDGGGEIDFGTPPEGRAWVGAFIRIDVPESYGSIPKAAGNNTAFPRVLGNASLKFGPNRTSTAVRITSEETDLFRPHPTLEVTGAIVNCSPGITATAFPVSAEVCPESQCTSE